jgi:hypothetical protein
MSFPSIIGPAGPALNLTTNGLYGNRQRQRRASGLPAATLALGLVVVLFFERPTHAVRRPVQSGVAWTTRWYRRQMG